MRIRSGAAGESSAGITNIGDRAGCGCQVGIGRRELANRPLSPRIEALVDRRDRELLARRWLARGQQVVSELVDRAQRSGPSAAMRRGQVPGRLPVRSACEATSNHWIDRRRTLCALARQVQLN